MTSRKINLFLSGILAIILLFCTPHYNEWLNTKILQNNDVFFQMTHLDENGRKISRYGYSYQIYMALKERMKTLGDVTLLLPPAQYMHSRKMINEVVMPEPAVFYYYTGMKSVWVTSPDIYKANYDLDVNSKGEIIVKKIPSKNDLDTLITKYKKYLPH